MDDGATHRAVIIGAGFGGLFAARGLRGIGVDVTVIDRFNHHLFQPLLYQVATGILSQGDIAPAIRDVLRSRPTARVQLAEVRAVDLDRRVVVAERPGRVLETPYDSLIVATGVHTSGRVSSPSCPSGRRGATSARSTRPRNGWCS